LTNQNSKNLTADDFDWFAIKVAVREGKYMALTRYERTIAVKLMREKGYSSAEIGDLLGMESPAVTKAFQRPWPYPRHLIPDEVMGGKVISMSKTATALPRATVRRITGR
jgi:hypothetical protein